jgi:hypothetical protein
MFDFRFVQKKEIEDLIGTEQTGFYLGTKKTLSYPN